jgi:predicted glycoside hydrolase/deacetylase ChbG (UPF0249 family)
MRYLVVNADDFGISGGVNRGIAAAHRRGIVTSASLMIGRPGSGDAARIARECPALSVGLHAVVPDEAAGSSPDGTGACGAALSAQLRAFGELLGRPPTHLDSHHHVHCRAPLLRAFGDVADDYGIPLRACSEVRYCPSFYGQWGGRSHPEQVSVAGLIGLLERELGDGVTELACHPGYPDPDLVSSYAIERSLELQTLCDPRVRRFVERRRVALIGFGEVPRVLGTNASRA